MCERQAEHGYWIVDFGFGTRGGSGRCHFFLVFTTFASVTFIMERLLILVISQDILGFICYSRTHG